MPLSVVSALVHAYIGWRLLPALGAFGPPAQVVVAILLLASAISFQIGLNHWRHRRRDGSDQALTAAFVAMGLVSMLLVLTLLRDVVLLVAAVVRMAWPAMAIPGVSTWTAVAVPALAVFATLLGFISARRTARVVAVDVPIVDLPPALAGFTIAQITDIHVGPTIKRPYVESIVDAVNRLEADMVAVTGDLVDGSVAQLSSDVAALRGLSSRHGTYFVTGNHEYYSGATAWVAELRNLGINVLINEHVVIDHDGAALAVAGVTDPSAHHFDASHRSDPAGAIADAPADVAVRILLAHQPRTALVAASSGYHLQLSGHTHGGQFWPWNFFVRLQQPFTAGLHRLKDLWVYTSRGTGYWGPPNRFGAPSEITRVRLVPA